ncbi:MAG: DNA adenine methylase [Bacteroidia bacterium]|nr:DNA adenine methylase [Bacteroidia bacterium]
MAEQLTLFGDLQHPDRGDQVVNIASVPQRSPFRYPGGKTWLIPVVRRWLKQEEAPAGLIEPFAGGGIVSLTAAFEQLARHITMIELDEDVAAVWETLIHGDYDWLANRIMDFDLNHANIQAALDSPAKSIQEMAFCTILKNRVFHGGILAKGSGLIKHGENGKGIASRWYPATLKHRIAAIGHVRDRISFQRGDAFEVLEQLKERRDLFFFIDPPYTVAGKRLYTHFDIDHERLFAATACLQGKYMLTYDDTEEIRSLASTYRLPYRTIPMKTTHHLKKTEIIISDNFEWWD